MIKKIFLSVRSFLSKIIYRIKCFFLYKKMHKQLNELENLYEDLFNEKIPKNLDEALKMFPGGDLERLVNEYSLEDKYGK